MHANQLTISASGLHAIMGAPKEIDPDLMTPALDEAKALTAAKRNAEQKQALADALDSTLSAGGKTYVRNLFKAQYLDFNPRRDLQTVEIRKGLTLEGEAIQFFADQYFVELKKNAKRFDIEIEGVKLTGEPDLLPECDPFKDFVIDTKVVYSSITMPLWLEEAEKSEYYWQLLSYMLLTGRRKGIVAYTLLDTPEELRKYDALDIHEVSHLDCDKRLFEWRFDWCEADYQLMLKKIAACGRYYQKLLRERGLCWSVN